MKRQTTKSLKLAPQEAKMILDFITDSESRLEESNKDTLIREVVKTTFYYLKERARLYMQQADKEFAEVMNGR